MSRPGNELLDEERWVALLGDSIDALESVAAAAPNHLIEDALGSIRFVKSQIARRFDPVTGARR